MVTATLVRPVPQAYGVNVKATIGLIMMLLSAAAYGQLMKCVGKDGKIEYASQCPPGTKEQATGIRSSPQGAPPAAEAQQKSLSERDADFRKRQSEKQEAQAKDAKKTAENEERSRACERARAYLKSLETRNRVVKRDPQTGERIYLDEAGYQAEIAATQRSIETNCK